ncbi:MAG: hypothetical protein MZW92_68045 [Comamonadaceae bacterium]|nr:hypothetical protein [Comamonadaceae bacterium]
MLHLDFDGKPDLEALKAAAAQAKGAFVRVRWVVAEERWCRSCGDRGGPAPEPQRSSSKGASSRSCARVRRTSSRAHAVGQGPPMGRGDRVQPEGILERDWRAWKPPTSMRSCRALPPGKARKTRPLSRGGGE